MSATKSSVSEEDVSSDEKPRRQAAPQTIQIRNSDPSQNTMFYVVKCKHAVCLCVGILLIHFLVVSLMSAGRQVDTTVLLARNTRDTEETITAEDPVTEACSAGHVPGFPAICDPSGCLRTLSRPQSIMPQGQLAVQNISKELGCGSQAVGWLAPVHNDLLTMLTYIQWQHDVYGTVGGLGSNQPILTFALASQLDIAAGEHLMLSDRFPLTTHTHFDKLYTYLNKLEAVNHDHTEHFHVHVGSPGELTKDLLRRWGLPQFRIMTIEGDSDPDVMFSRLEKAMCVLHEGGIVIVDGLDTNAEETYSAVRKFFDSYGNDVLAPLLSTQDKLYLCTSKWRTRFMEKIGKQYQSFLISFHGREVRNSLYGAGQSSYYSLQR